MIVSSSVLKAMSEGLRRIKRVPEREWLQPVIEQLDKLKPGDRFTIEYLNLEK